MVNQKDFDKWFNKLSDKQITSLLYDYDIRTLPYQRPPPEDEWDIWLFLGGRGVGKSAAMSWYINKILTQKTDERIAFVTPTSRDYIKTSILGESGILKTFPKSNQPKWSKTSTRIIKNNNIVDFYEATSPDRIRGLNASYAFLDEFCAMKNADYCMQMVQMALRKGNSPKLIICTTPRPMKALKDLLKQSEDPKNRIKVTRATTFDNPHLPQITKDILLRTYDGTSIGRQELYGEVIDTLSGNLFKLVNIEKGRIRKEYLKDIVFKRIVVAIDPAVSNTESSDHTGIVVCAIALINGLLHGYVLEDQTCKASPGDWGRVAVNLYHKYGADRIIGEVNNGGDLVQHVINGVEKHIPFTNVRATRGKQTRAEPVAALYEQGLIHHVGNFKDLEEQMTEYDPLFSQKSPDRMDALVWGFTELMFKQGTMSVGVYKF